MMSSRIWSTITIAGLAMSISAQASKLSNHDQLRVKWHTVEFLNLPVQPLTFGLEICAENANRAPVVCKPMGTLKAGYTPDTTNNAIRKFLVNAHSRVFSGLEINQNVSTITKTLEKQINKPATALKIKFKFVVLKNTPTGPTGRPLLEAYSPLPSNLSSTKATASVQAKNSNLATNIGFNFRSEVTHVK